MSDCDRVEQLALELAAVRREVAACRAEVRLWRVLWYKALALMNEAARAIVRSGREADETLAHAREALNELLDSSATRSWMKPEDPPKRH
jgi:hypothetical protein